MVRRILTFNLILIFLVLSGWLWWKGPSLLIRDALSRRAAAKSVLSDQDYLRAISDVRANIAQVIQGIGLIVSVLGAYYTVAVNRRTKLTDLYTKAIEQIGMSDKEGKPVTEVRAGGMSLLARIARESPADRETIVRIVSTYLKHYAHYEDGTQPKIFIQKELEEGMRILGDPTVRPWKYEVNDRRAPYVDLMMVDLRHMNLSGLSLSGLNL